jgi:hypothetical protein
MGTAEEGGFSAASAIPACGRHQYGDVMAASGGLHHHDVY